MPKKPQLAKLMRPRLYKAVARERLFKLLDEKREHPVVWIVGPPGAGKTTLAASYLEEAGVPAIWYQIDPGDSDPATFFYYLKQGMEAVAKRKAKPLPLLTPEYLPDLPGFARRFLRDGFARFPEETILVFDNYHDIAESSALHAPFAAALAEVPPGSNVIVLSRTDPSPTFAEALVNQTIATVTWEALRLTQDETTMLAASRGITDKADLVALHEQSTGWMAGVTLMLERLRGGTRPEVLGKGEALDTVFNYFAGLIFDKASDETQDVLMKTAFLPRVSAPLAEAVTGKPIAIQHLEELHRRHLFTDRIAGTEVSYQYHALFRSFLRSRAVVVYTLEQRRAIAKCVAALMLADGQIDHAFALLAEAEDWGEAEKLLIRSAPNLIAQGRWQTLGLWVQTLPKHRLDANPWVGYWLGRSKNLVNPASARPSLDAAYRFFTETGDEVGQLLSATAMLEGFYFEYENFRPMDSWIERVSVLLKRGVLPPAKEDELRANLVLIMGATLRASPLSIHEFCLNRVAELLKGAFDANTKVTAAGMLHEYAAVAMDFEVVQRAMEIAHPLLDSPDLSAPCALLYFQAEAYTLYLHGKYDLALADFDAAARIARENDFQNGIANLVEYQRGVCERRAGLLDQAEKTIRQIENRSRPASEYLKGGLSILKAAVAFDRGDISRAIDTALIAYRYHEISGEFGGTVVAGAHCANMAIAGQRFDVAADILGQLRRIEYGSVAQNYLGIIAVNEAWLAHRTGDCASRDRLLAEALLRARDARARIRMRWYANALADLLPIAIAARIEAKMARALAREFSVVPEPQDVEEWPWPVKAYVLGRFELLLDGESPAYSRKVPKKVLALLKAIIAFGAREVPEQKLVDALWPDEDGDAARRSLGATLHRLRKLLKCDNAIWQAGGNLTLDERSCWVDATAFENRLPHGGDAAEVSEAAILLYRGAFLAQEDAPWAMPMRERLRAKFIHAVGKLGVSFEASGRHESAIDLYVRGIEADNLVEPFYQGLMRCYDKLNRRAEAMSAYRRLRETLSITLGVPPSSATQRLFETLRLN